MCDPLNDDTFTIFLFVMQLKRSFIQCLQELKGRQILESSLCNVFQMIFWKISRSKRRTFTLCLS